MENYKIIKLVDISLASAKRYEAFVLYDGENQMGVLEEAAELVRGMNYHRNSITRSAWEGTKASVVWVHLCKTLDQYRHGEVEATIKKTEDKSVFTRPKQGKQD